MLSSPGGTTPEWAEWSDSGLFGRALVDCFIEDPKRAARWLARELAVATTERPLQK